jgi:CheY-like chemotaxis protein
MFVLLVEDDRISRLATTRLAESLGHKVQAVESAEEAMVVLARGGVELLFTDLILPKKTGLDLTRWLRGQEKEGHLYVLLLTSRDSQQSMEEAFAAGVDDFVTKGSSPAEIAGRFRVAERISRVEAKLRQRAEELDTAMRRLEISAAMRGNKAVAAAAAAPTAPVRRELLADLRAWTSHESTLKAVLAENVHQDFLNTESPSGLPEDALAARITLTDVEHKLELEIVLLAARTSAFAIACGIFGDPSIVEPEMVPDTLLELANGTMGAFKTAFQVEDYKFTPGIPKAITPQPVSALLAKATDRRVYTYRAGDAILTVLLGVREKKNQKLKVRALTDGMVLAEALYQKTGALLLKAGTRLSEVLIERLAHIDKDMLVELSDPGDD